MNENDPDCEKAIELEKDKESKSSMTFLMLPFSEL
jgi:hypothetical protein